GPRPRPASRSESRWSAVRRRAKYALSAPGGPGLKIPAPRRAVRGRPPSDERPAAERKERQEETRRCERNRQAEHDLDQLAKTAACIAEGQSQASHDTDDDGDDLGDRHLDGLEDALKGCFPWHRRTGRMGGRGEQETNGKGGCGGRHA